jgi:hypothetical protein
VSPRFPPFLPSHISASLDPLRLVFREQFGALARFIESEETRTIHIGEIGKDKSAFGHTPLAED